MSAQHPFPHAAAIADAARHLTIAELEDEIRQGHPIWAPAYVTVSSGSSTNVAHSG